MILVNNVYFQYTKEFYILSDVSLKIKNSERIAIFGADDSGKSTLLRLIAGVEMPTKGSILINNINTKKIDFKNDVNLGYLGASGTFFNYKTVEDNLRYVLKIRKIPKSSIDIKVEHALMFYGLDIIRNKKIKDLTLLEKLRVNIARLSLRKIDIFLIDDIFSDVDAKECENLVDLLLNLVETNNATLVVATNNLDVVKPFNCKVINLKNGVIIDN